MEGVVSAMLKSQGVPRIRDIFQVLASDHEEAYAEIAKRELPGYIANLRRVVGFISLGEASIDLHSVEATGLVADVIVHTCILDWHYLEFEKLEEIPENDIAALWTIIKSHRCRNCWRLWNEWMDTWDDGIFF